ncbi:hypothetical protein JCM16303_006599 [Sporobolomyces ruberrimus]
MDSIDDADDWDQLRRFTSLKKLASRGITLDEQHPPLPVVHFDARHGDPLSLKVVQTSMGQALRHLRIPVNLVPSLQVLEFPHLRHLAINARGPLDEVASYQFRLDLQKLESLEVFELDDKAFNSIGGGIRRFGETLPLSCCRINLNCTVDNKRSPAIKAIRSLIPHLNKGHIVREVGLETHVYRSLSFGPFDPVRNGYLALHYVYDRFFQLNGKFVRYPDWNTVVFYDPDTDSVQTRTIRPPASSGISSRTAHALGIDKRKWLAEHARHC